MTRRKDWKKRKKQKPKITDKKLRGEWAEMVFMTRATELGIPISKPWGEMRSYDFIVGRPRHFVCVQVKSTICEYGTGYVCAVKGGHKPYPPGSFDFLAAYVVDENAWYIVPEKEVWGKGCLTFYPKSEKAKYEKYREAWHLLDPDPEETIDIQACADPNFENSESERFSVGEGSSGGSEMRPRGLEALNPFRWLTRR